VTERPALGATQHAALTRLRAAEQAAVTTLMSRLGGASPSLAQLYASPENAGKSPATIAGWFVDDLDQTMDELGSRGVVFEQYAQPGIKTDSRGIFDAGRFRAAWVKDPDGNTMALTEVSG